MSLFPPKTSESKDQHLSGTEQNKGRMINSALVKVLDPHLMLLDVNLRRPRASKTFHSPLLAYRGDSRGMLRSCARYGGRWAADRVRYALCGNFCDSLSWCSRYRRNSGARKGLNSVEGAH